MDRTLPSSGNQYLIYTNCSSVSPNRLLAKIFCALDYYFIYLNSHLQGCLYYRCLISNYGNSELSSDDVWEVAMEVSMEQGIIYHAAVDQ